MPIEFEEFRGNPLIVLKRDENDTYPFRFGIRKAELIIENIEEIKRFVEEKKISKLTLKEKKEDETIHSPTTPKIKLHTKKK